MKILACPSCDRIYFEASTHVVINYYCPECGRKGIEPTAEQRLKFITTHKEYHFSPDGLRLDHLPVLKENLKIKQQEIKNIEKEINQIEIYLREKNG